MIFTFLEKLFNRGSATISYSRLKSFIFCPYKYKLIYVDNWKIPPNPFMSLGLTIHDVLEEFKKRGLSTLDELRSVYDELWVNLGFKDAAETVEFYENGQKMLSDYFNWEQERIEKKIKTIYIEKEFEFPLNNHKIKGIIDRVDLYPDGSYEIIDYKTHRVPWLPERLENDMQLNLYAMGIIETFGITPRIVSHFFVAQNKYLSANFSKEAVAPLKKTIIEMASKISAGKFIPRLESCSKCDFRNNCPKFSARGKKLS